MYSDSNDFKIGSNSILVDREVTMPATNVDSTETISHETAFEGSREQCQLTPQEDLAKSTLDWQSSMRNVPVPVNEVNQNLCDDPDQWNSFTTPADLLNSSRAKVIEGGLDDAKQAYWVTRQVNALQWLLKKAANKPKVDGVTADEKKADRLIAKAELKMVSPREWIELKGAVNRPHSAIYLLSEGLATTKIAGGMSVDTLRNRNYLASMNGSKLDTTHLGAVALPSRIWIRSLPIAKILHEICDGKLPYNKSQGLVILHPFKMLMYLENDIRSQLEELRKVCQDHHNLQVGTIASGPDQPPIKNDKARSVFSSDDIFNLKIDWQSLTLKDKEEAARDFGCLVEFIDQYLIPLRTALCTATEVYFAELWYLFTPGSLIYVKNRTTPQKVWKVIGGTSGRKSIDLASHTEEELQSQLSRNHRCNSFSLDCYYIDWNGVCYYRVQKTFVIEEFSDIRLIDSLPFLPLHRVEEQGLVNRDELLERASQFVQCTKPTYGYYLGRSMSLAPNGHKLRQSDKNTSGMGSVMTLSEHVESQVMVDFERGFQHNPDWATESSEPLFFKTPAEELLEDNIDPVIDDHRAWDIRIAEPILAPSDLSQEREEQGVTLSAEDKLILPARVVAFVFRTRRWACLELGRDASNPKKQKLTQVEPKSGPWRELEISPNHRTVIESLMAAHFSTSKSGRRHFDFVRDKGKGVVILLHGVPGVGKTSTAETVAEYYNKPLLPITCGELGLSPREVEGSLDSCFQMAQAWDCVLLLDEADIFLTERSTDNENRNALVSVFLRVLEYYEGVLFLTTNKVGAFDEAFKSRISMALYYPPLRVEQTLSIWKSQMRSISKNFPEIAFNTIDLEHYARHIYHEQSTNDCFKPVWNGRQIRNAFQTAVSLAEYHSQDKRNIEVTRSHFEEVAKVYNQFNNYLWHVKRSRTDEYRNLNKELRADNFVPDSESPIPIHLNQPSTTTSSPYLSQQTAMHSFTPPGMALRQQGLATMSPIPYVAPQYTGHVQAYHPPSPSEHLPGPPQSTYTTTGQQQPPHLIPQGYSSHGQTQQIFPHQN